MAPNLANSTRKRKATKATSRCITSAKRAKTSLVPEDENERAISSDDEGNTTVTSAQNPDTNGDRTTEGKDELWEDEIEEVAVENDEVELSGSPSSESC